MQVYIWTSHQKRYNFIYLGDLIVDAPDFKEPWEKAF